MPPRRKCGRVGGITQAVLPDDFEAPDYSIECSEHQLGKIDLDSDGLAERDLRMSKVK